MTTPLQRLALVLAGAVTCACSLAAARRTTQGRSAMWQRVNYRGKPVSLLGGPVAVTAAAAGIAVLAAVSTDHARRTAVAMLIVLIAAGAAGLYDDLHGDVRAKGLAGHLRTAARGRVTSGVVKIAVLGIAGLAAAAILRPLSPQLLADAVLIATAGNLANLLDLRPGRAAKALLAGFAVLVTMRGGGSIAPVAWCAGALAGVLPADLRERVMLGDAGANAFGAALGVAVVATTAPAARLTALAVVVGLTLLSEFVSFSRVIAAVPPLRWLDNLGRVEPARQAAA